MYTRNEQQGRYVAYQTSAQSAVPAPSNVFRNAEERGAGPNSRHRMSLLHPHQPAGDYNISLASTPLTQRQDRPPQPPGPHYGGDGVMMKLPLSESPPCKKPRLGDAKDLHLPLRIETDRSRSGPAYNPQVEAISPILPSESIRDESPLRSTKEDLLAQIARVDREIAKTESQIAKLKKKKVELEEAANHPQKDTEESSNASDTVIQSLPQSIYAENRKKAAAAHQCLLKLSAHNDLPVYNQPADTSAYQENNLSYAALKPRLLLHFKKRQCDKEKQDTYFAKSYASSSYSWARNVERIENSPKRKQQEARKREAFEKVFPELRKQREDKERFSRVSRIKSDADLEEIMDGLHEQEMEDKKMRSYAVIPPALLDHKTRLRQFINTNGLIEDPMQEYKDKQLFNIWTDQEKEIFKEKYLQHPKNFGIIKSYLERKSIPDCVQYYYLSKKTQNYRQLLRKSRARPRTRNQQQNSSAHNNPPPATATSAQVLGVVKQENNGVTTRQQKESKSEQVATNSASCTSGAESLNPVINNPATSPAPINLPLNNTNEDTTSNPITPTVMSESFATPRKKSKALSKEEEANDLDSSEDEMELNGEKGGPHTCVSCRMTVENYMQSRPISRSQAAQYGLNENEIQISDRVCVSCRSKAVRRRFKSTQCPIPTCPSKRARIIRLRQFPPKWDELCESKRAAIISKYQIPENVTKCCTACYNRISRRMAPNANLDTPDDPGCDTTRWTEEEIDIMKKGLTEIGTDWVKLSERIPSKSELQCRNFYFNYRKKYGLDSLVHEHKKSKGSDGPPTLTDEEESGSTTSSCDETGTNPHDSRPSLEKKQDDYDSSATVSAEEVEEKSSMAEDIKPFPTSSDGPLSLTIRANSMEPTHFNPQKSAVPHPSIQPSSLAPNNLPVPTVSITPRHNHPGLIHHSQNSPSPHAQLSLQNFPHGPGSVTVHQGPLGTAASHISHQIRRYPSPDNSDNQEPITLKVNDILDKAIERTLRMNPANNNASSNIHPGPSVSPTITSILKSQDRSHLPPQGTHPVLAPTHPGSHNSQNEPTLHHSQSVFSHHQPYYQPKPDIRPPPHLPSQESLSMVHVLQRDECGTLDLSMKKRSPSPHASIQRPPSNGPPPAHQTQPLDFASRPHQSDIHFPTKYTSIRNRAPLPPPPVKSSKVPPVPPLLTKPPNLSPVMKDGSITHGTPLHHPQSITNKFDGQIIRSKEGSITQGTPVDKLRAKESIPYSYTNDRQEYYKRNPYMHGTTAVFYGRPLGQRNSPPSVPGAANFPLDQHNNSRQIIINDYFTSQQMQNPVVSHSPHLHPPQNSIAQRLETPKRNPVPANLSMSSGNPPYGIPQRSDIAYRQSPSPSCSPHQQQRQGVIYRANSRVGSVVKVEPGQNDAFSKLVDAAASAPSLPVPKEDTRNRVNLPRVDMVREGLGKSMAEMERRSVPNPHTQIYRSSNHMTLQPGPIPDSIHRVKLEPEPNRFMREKEGGGDTLTAASLIDAIITHQINLPSPNDRQSPAPTSKSDKLFASLQRSSQTPSISHSPVSAHNVPQSTSGIQNMHVQEKIEESRPANHKLSHSGTLRERIDLIISNDYASPKGSGPNTSSAVPAPLSVTAIPPAVSSGQAHPPPKKDNPHSWGSKSWKLRLALQSEKELQKENHPDERHIIRVAQPEDKPSRPLPHSVQDAANGNGNVEYSESHPVESGQAGIAPGTTSTNEKLLNKGSAKESISPLDYVNNLIVVKMRTENIDEKTEDDKSKSNNLEGNHLSSVGNPNSGTSVIAQQNHVASFPGTSQTDDRPQSEPARYFDPQVIKKDEGRKIEESDSPASMVIDETTEDQKEKSTSSAPEAPTATNSIQPKYEPVTDEES